MCDNQCTAYLGNKRCINTSIGSSNHCQLHCTKATKLYLKYKKLCKEVENLDLYLQFDNINEQINHLLNCYYKLNKAYKARQKHRQYAFVPECYDQGHLYQITKLSTKMEECEQILNKIINLSNPFNEKDENVKENEQEQNVVLKIKREIFNYKQFRQQQEIENNTLIEKYIEENSMILKNKAKLLNLIVTYVDTLYQDDIDYFIKHIVSFHLVGGLYSCCYFDDFKPQRCQDITCGCFISYNVNLACSCVLNHSSIYTYFNIISEQTIKKYYELSLKYKNKIIPLLRDVVNLYKKYGDNIMFIKLHFVWYDNLKRLVLEENFYEHPKMSKLFSQTRLKDKFYYRKMQNDYLIGN